MLHKDAEKQKIVCDFGGATMSWSQDFQFNVDHLTTALGHCEVIVFGQYLFDRTINNTNIFILDSDISNLYNLKMTLTTLIFSRGILKFSMSIFKDAIQSITQIGTPVYISIGYMDYIKWAELMEPQDQNRFNYLMDGLVTFLNEYQISGVVMQSNYIYVS